MKQQNYANHRRYVPAYHFLTSGIIVVVFIIAAIELVKGLSKGELLYSGLLPVMVAIVLLLLFWYARRFSTKVQDRTIRAEENLRHYVLTGKLLDTRLTMPQIVALRFAPDEEYLELIEQAINRHMKPEEIKKAIRNWKADHHRA
ncbi:MAG: DUF6526 family protein [Chitinophagales bacterium]